MKVKLLRSEEKIKLVQAVADRNKERSMRAQETLAALVSPIVEQVIDLAATSAMFFDDYTYNFDETPSIPLDLFEDVGENYVRTWSQTIAGGLPTNLIHGLTDFRFTTYRLDSAISFLKRYAQQARLEVLARGIERMAQELVVKIEHNAWAIMLKALADGGTNHMVDATTANVFQIEDLNQMILKMKRLRTAWNGGTPATLNRRGISDLVVSPEIVAQIRAFAYQPMNTRAVPDTAESTALGLPDSIREQFYNAAGIPSIFDISIHELFEFGDNQSYNLLFDAFYGGSFTGASDQLVLGIDNGAGALVRAVATAPTHDIDVSSTIETMVDDQFPARSEKWGWYTRLEEGRVCVDNKIFVGCKV